MTSETGSGESPGERSDRSAPRRPAVVLVSGGLDSATTLAVARREGFECHALSFDYGQRHRFELEAAASVCEQIGVTAHQTIALDENKRSL